MTRIIAGGAMMAVGFTTLFFTLHVAAIRNEVLRRRLRRLRILEASEIA